MRRQIGRHSGSRADSLWELLNLGTPDETAWMSDALCAQTDPDAFYPEKGGSARSVKAVCLACPVRNACLGYALEHREQFGIWGGLSPNERQALRSGAADPTGEAA